MQGLEELSYRFVAAQAKQNIVYTEVRYSPHLYIASFQLFFFGGGTVFVTQSHTPSSIEVSFQVKLLTS